jgi:hypothetical protein
MVGGPPLTRDNSWKNIPATELVPGDTIKLSLGGVVAADVKLVEGSILLADPASDIMKRSEEASLLKCAGTARRSHRDRHRHRNTHEVWTHRGTRPYRPGISLPARSSFDGDGFAGQHGARH